jgi:predicted DCC family thiol-disulfide oxidoreductase YuxK
MSYIRYIISTYLKVDLRTLGIFRFVFGLVCFFDIYRRVGYIDTFYSDVGLTPLKLTSVSSFSLLSYFNIDSVAMVSLFFYIGLFFSFLFIVGYKTKFSQLITVLVVLSIHNRLIIVENGGDFVMNAFLIWALFLPLGRRFSIDRLLYSLKNYKDATPHSLNSGSLLTNEEPKNYWGVAYLACILQLSIIYFFNFTNKFSGTWEEGTSLYYFYKLDIFLTPLGNFIKEFSMMPMWLSQILTGITLQLEFWVPILLFTPIYVLWLRRFTMVSMIGFHIVIGITMYIGMFSWVMVAALLLLLSAQDINIFKRLISKLSSGPFIVFYDSDCGFCHQTARIIRRMDLFENLKWAGKDWTDEKPDELPELSDSTIVVWDQSKNKVYNRHEAFSRIISSLPFGFLFSWVLLIPLLSNIFGYLYDLISTSRTSISKFFGYSGCDISRDHNNREFRPLYVKKRYHRETTFTVEIIKTILVCLLLMGTVNYAFAKCYQKTKNRDFKESIEGIGFLTSFKSSSYSYKFIRQSRMIQNWNMFYSVPRSYKWMVLEATLNDENETYDKRETFSDKGNGVYDDGEDFIDEGNGKWEPGEEFFDRKDLEVSNSDSVVNSVFNEDVDILEVIGGLRVGNGVYDAGEKFIDKGNGVYDKGEQFTDRGNGVYDEGEAYINVATTIDLLTGKPPNYSTLNYNTFRQVDNSQFWRKFINRINPYSKSGDSYSKYRKRFVELLSQMDNPVIPFSDLNQDGKVDEKDQIKSVSLYNLNYSVKTGRVSKNDISNWIYKRRSKSRKKINLSKSKFKKVIK